MNLLYLLFQFKCIKALTNYTHVSRATPLHNPTMVFPPAPVLARTHVAASTPSAIISHSFATMRSVKTTSWAPWPLLVSVPNVTHQACECAVATCQQARDTCSRPRTWGTAGWYGQPCCWPSPSHHGPPLGEYHAWWVLLNGELLKSYKPIPLKWWLMKVKEVPLKLFRY